MSASGLGIDRSVSVSKAKTKLTSLVRRVKTRNEIVALALTHHGVPSAVLLSIDQYQGLIETAEILSDRKAMRSLRRSLKQVGKGEWIDHQECSGLPQT
jgi:antitoxin YefM